MVGLVVNDAVISRLFPADDKEVIIESSNAVPRGTFFRLLRGERELIPKTAVSIRRLELGAFNRYEVSEFVVGYHCPAPSSKTLDVLLLVNLRKNAYAVYWGGCRADKCNKADWQFWDQQNELFLEQTD